MVAPDIPMTPLAFLDRAARVHPRRTAIVDGPRRFTYTEMWDTANRLALGLRGFGVRSGQVAAFLASNSAETLIAHFGVPLAGNVLVTINTRLARDEVRYICDHSEAKVLFVDPDLYEQLEPLRAELPVERYVVLPDAGGSRVEVDDTTCWEDFIANAGNDRLPFEVDDEDRTITINYTSGTTGKPKGVMYSHRGAYLNALNQVIHQGFTPSSVYLWTLPMFHCNGWCTTWAMTATAGTHVCLRAVRGPDIWRLIDAENVTHMAGAPTVLSIMAGDEAAHELDSPITVTTAGAAPSPTIIERFNALNAAIVHVYGLTETYGPYTVCERQPSWADLNPSELAVQMARQGVGMVGSDIVRVVEPQTDDGDNDELIDVAADGKTMGEIVMRGNTTMKGYFKDDDATDEAFRGGWFHSGDLGVMHPDGYVRLLDRAKDVVVSGGENISTVEVEQAILRHEAVQDVAVIGVPHERWGEVPKAFVVLAKGARADEQEIIAHAKSKIASYKAPKAVEFVDELPVNSAGKVKKHELREKEWAGRESRIQG